MDLIARDRKSYGCFALKIKHGKHLVELKRRLNKIVGYNDHFLFAFSTPLYSNKIDLFSTRTTSNILSKSLSDDL